jgi:hypothetical protein
MFEKEYQVQLEKDIDFVEKRGKTNLIYQEYPVLQVLEYDVVAHHVYRVHPATRLITTLVDYKHLVQQET